MVKLTGFVAVETEKTTANLYACGVSNPMQLAQIEFVLSCRHQEFVKEKLMETDKNHTRVCACSQRDYGNTHAG